MLFHICWYWEVGGCLPEKHRDSVDVIGTAEVQILPSSLS